MPNSLSRLTLLATTTLLFSGLLETDAFAADRLELMEKQIRAMQAEVQELKKERAAERKRISVALAKQREETETNPYQQRTGYLPPAFLSPAAAPISVLRRSAASQDTPPSDRGIVSSWKDFQQASTQDEEVTIGGMKIGFPNGRPTFKTTDGAYALSIGLAFQEDFGGFLGVSQRNGESRGTFNSFTSNSRRLRIPFTFRYKDWVANVTPDFGHGNFDGQVGLYEANINYAGLHNTVLTVGYFQPRVTEEDAESSNDFLLLERPAIVDMVRTIAANDARFSIGGMHYANRWWIGGYFTGQSWGNRAENQYYLPIGKNVTDSQTGGTFRVAGRPIATKDVDLHVGVSSIASFKVAQTADGRSYTFAQRPEINIGESVLQTTGAIQNVAQVWAAGPEFAMRWKRLMLKAEYYRIGIERSGGLPSLAFQGWYSALGYTVFGNPRRYSIQEGGFLAPGVPADGEFDPARNQWGALEIAARYSVADLNSRLDRADGVRGGQQTVWATGLNWYPNRHFKFMVDYNHFIVSRSTTTVNQNGRTGDAVVGRVQAAF
ncbi:OprO/OprP family phosphate-selective porin [Gluconobacter frateurii]|uniref:OprO/OprP family phosphate-selective porin n=1 Tax=Gluconobacter frateurii TaxID=38308 RepID=UPI001F05685C|nr:porin [Gluconobacter frateurii]UMM09418.1 OprO/OprP family phosphate-selective porin [Gluconobacter frateurii]